MAFKLPSTKSVKILTDALEIAVQTLEFIAKLTKTTKDDEAAKALAAIRVALKSAEQGVTGKITKAEVDEARVALRKALAKNDASALAALKAKFKV